MSRKRRPKLSSQTVRLISTFGQLDSLVPPHPLRTPEITRGGSGFEWEDEDEAAIRAQLILRRWFCGR